MFVQHNNRVTQHSTCVLLHTTRLFICNLADVLCAGHVSWRATLQSYTEFSQVSAWCIILWISLVHAGYTCHVPHLGDVNTMDHFRLLTGCCRFGSDCHNNWFAIRLKWFLSQSLFSGSHVSEQPEPGVINKIQHGEQSFYKPTIALSTSK